MNKLIYFPLAVFLLWICPVGSSAQDTLAQLAEGPGRLGGEHRFIAKGNSESWQYFDLGCESASPWSGYFAPHRWTKRPPDYRVTDAGNVLLPPGETSRTWTIRVPADGYLSFHLSTSGGLTPPSPVFLHNGEPTPPPLRLPDGTLYSSYLYRGDELTLELPAAPADLLLADLQFYTNARGVFISSNAPTRSRISASFSGTNSSGCDFPVLGMPGSTATVRPGRYSISTVTPIRLTINTYWTTVTIALR